MPSANPKAIVPSANPKAKRKLVLESDADKPVKKKKKRRLRSLLSFHDYGKENGSS
jgi:hypothetical protein